MSPEDAPTTPAAAPASSAPASPAEAAPAPAATPPAPSLPAGDDFSQLGLPEDDDEGAFAFVGLGEEPGGEPEPPPAEPGAAAETPPPAPPAAPSEAPTAAPPATPAAAPGPEAAPAQSAELPEPLTPQQLVEQLAQHRAPILEGIAKERFQLSDDEMSALETDAVGAIPQLLARTYYETLTASLQNMQHFMPRMIAQFMQMKEASDRATDAFFSAHPHLDRKNQAILGDALNFAGLYKQQNPQITQADLFALVNAAVVTKHKIAVQAPAPNGSGQGQPKPAPFVPARSAAPVMVTPEPTSPFAGLGQDFDDEE